MTTSLNRDPQINALCPARRVHSDDLYSEWVLNVADTLEPRDTLYIKADLDSWDAWTAEAQKIHTYQNRNK